MKGLMVEKHARYSIVLTPTGSYKKVYGHFKEEVGQEISLKSGITIPRTVSAVAALVLILLSLALPVIRGQNQAYAYVTLDINPSVEFAINEDYRVLKAHAYDQEADRILSGLEYKGQDIKSVLAEFTRSALSLQSWDDTEPNHVLVSFYSKHTEDEQSAEAELMHIMEAQREVLLSSGKQAHIDTVVVDRETYKEAHRLGVSAGKLIESEKKNQEKTEKETGAGRKIEKDSKENSKKDSSESDLYNREAEVTKKAHKDKESVKDIRSREKKELNPQKDSTQGNAHSQKKEYEDKSDKELKNRGQANKKAKDKEQEEKQEKNNNKKKTRGNRKNWNNKKDEKKDAGNPKKTQSRNKNPNKGSRQGKGNGKGKEKYHVP